MPTPQCQLETQTPRMIMVNDHDQSQELSNEQQPDLMLKISNFVDQMRLQNDQVDEMDQRGRQPRSSVNAPGLDNAQKRMEQAIVEAEKYKAAIEKPPGRDFNIYQPIMQNSNMTTTLEQFNTGKFSGGNDNVVVIHPPQSDQSVSVSRDSADVRQVVGSGLSDDDFFHITCHIDDNLKRKIENGEFVDLDKLLPKDNGTLHGRINMSSETKLEWVQSEGSMYLVPAKSVSKVNCFRRWEQAFRMYVTIYCTKNPSRAREIWQYISVINTASMSYNWENVYNYDIVFRQLMEFNPKRSWAVTYNQMWNLSMTNPIIQSGPSSRKSFGSDQNNNQGGNKRKIDYYWIFNKGVKCKFGKKCKFIERCSYCDEASHGVVNCNKLEKKERDKGHFGKGQKGKS